MSPRVSVALATRDGGRYIDEQIAGILAQTRPVDQLVVSDDASSDDTLARIETALSGTPVELTILRNDAPLGVRGNFSRALAQVDGDIVVLSDQDDRWHPDRVAAALGRFDADPALDLLFSDADLIDARGARLGRTLLGSLEVSRRDLDALRAGEGFDVLLRRNLATGATVALRRRLLETALPVAEDWIHDEWLAVVAAAVGRVGLDDGARVDYRQHEANVIGARRPTLAHKVSRVLGRRGDRNAGLARRGVQLVQRLEALGDAVPPTRLASARAKLRFEERRARMPVVRPLRVGAVAILAMRGDYSRFASRGRLDVLRDLLQPA